jgi:hypothetical protein
MNPHIPPHWSIEQIMLIIFRADEWREVFIRTSKLGRDARARTYSLYISSHAWGNKRRERLVIDGHRCTSPLCFISHGLEVHHKTYARIGDEDVEGDLVTLCERCHRMAHIDPEWSPIAALLQRIKDRS